METVNHECYVSLEVAKLLKKAGFDWKCDKKIVFYSIVCENGIEFSRSMCDPTYIPFPKGIHIYHPTLDVAQRWLREVGKIHIEITFGSKWIYTLYNLTNLECLLSEDEFPETRNYNTYEEALEAGIKKALELILEKVE